MKFADAFSSKNDNSLFEILSQLYKFSRAMAFPEKWFEIVENSYKEEMITDVSGIKEEIKEAVENYLMVTDGLEDIPGAEKLIQIVNADAANFEGIDSFDYDDVFVKLHNAEFERFPTIKDPELKETAENVKNARDIFKNKIQKKFAQGFSFSSTHVLEFAKMQKETVLSAIDCTLCLND